MDFKEILDKMGEWDEKWSDERKLRHKELEEEVEFLKVDLFKAEQIIGKLKSRLSQYEKPVSNVQFNN